MAKLTIPVLNQSATRVFKELISRVQSPNQHARFDAGQGFMPLVVERLETYDIGTEYSLAHYYGQNGDLMRDPEIVFIDAPWGVIPCSYQQDGLGIYRIAFDYPAKKWSAKAVKDLAGFANMWMKNLKYQQKLEV